MVNHVLIENGLVVQSDRTGKPPAGFIEAPIEVCPGYRHDGGVFSAPPPQPDPPVDEISDRQFFQQLAVEKRITEAEALAAVATGTIPAAMQALIAQLPADQQFAARMLVSGATIFRRLHPVADMIQQLYQWSPEQRDTFWLAASKV